MGFNLDASLSGPRLKAKPEWVGWRERQPACCDLLGCEGGEGRKEKQASQATLHLVARSVFSGQFLLC